MKIADKKFVTLTYTLLVDGEVADMATEESPLGFVYGLGFLLPEFEKNIDGKKKGDKFEFTLTPEQGYGPSNPQMLLDLGKEIFMVDGKIEDGLLVAGNEIPMMTADGMRVFGRVVEIGKDSVKMDFNHPMAGKTLNFSGEIVGVREATEEDYPSADGGCSCGCEDDSSCGDCGCGC